MFRAPFLYKFSRPCGRFFFSQLSKGEDTRGDRIFKRIAAGMMSVLTLLTAMLSPAGAAEQNNTASAVEIKVGDTYNIADRGLQKHGLKKRCTSQRVADVHKSIR